MTLPASGSISTDQIRDELRVANPGRNYPLSTLDADVLSLAGKSAPPVKIPDDFYGKSAIGTLNAVGNNSSAFADSRNADGTVSCNPSVTVMGGSGAKSFAWSFLSNPNACTLSNATSQSCTVSKFYTKNSGGNATATLRCVVSDSTGSKTVDGITANLQWSGNQ